MADPTAGTPSPVPSTPRCPWCSAELPEPGAKTCPSCHANLVGEGDAQLPGLTAIDLERLAFRRVTTPKKSRLHVVDQRRHRLRGRDRAGRPARLARAAAARGPTRDAPPRDGRPDRRPAGRGRARWPPTTPSPRAPTQPPRPSATRPGLAAAASADGSVEATSDGRRPSRPAACGRGRVRRRTRGRLVLTWGPAARPGRSAAILPGMPTRLSPPGPSFLREHEVRVGDRRLRAGMSRPATLDDGWWLAILWVADDDGVVSFRDVAPSAVRRPSRPLARLGPALSGALSGLILEDDGRLSIRLAQVVPPDDPLQPWRSPLAIRAAFRWEPMRVGGDAPERARRDGPGRVPPRRRGARPPLTASTRRSPGPPTVRSARRVDSATT